MSHDRRCEKGRVVTDWRDKLGREDPFLRLLIDSEDLCACGARAWGMEVSLKIGLRIAEKKALRLWDVWDAVQREGAAAVGARLGKQIQARISGLNVIDIRDRQVERSPDDATR
jgi:hypothetical protein